jgi:hypothetical protein
MCGVADSPEESILLKFLHEIGHFACDHGKYGGVKFDDQGNIINKDVLDLKEQEAWAYARNIKSNENSTFQLLLDDYKNHK